MVNVVAPESGTVAAPPESACSSKLPSGEEMVHDSTPLLFQKTDVREPSGTLSGTAQISTSAGIVEAVGVGVGVGEAADAGVGVC